MEVLEEAQSLNDELVIGSHECLANQNEVLPSSLNLLKNDIPVRELPTPSLPISETIVTQNENLSSYGEKNPTLELVGSCKDHQSITCQESSASPNNQSVVSRIHDICSTVCRPEAVNLLSPNQRNQIVHKLQSAQSFMHGFFNDMINVFSNVNIKETSSETQSDLNIERRDNCINSSQDIKKTSAKSILTRGGSKGKAQRITSPEYKENLIAQKSKSKKRSPTVKKNKTSEKNLCDTTLVEPSIADKCKIRKKQAKNSLKNESTAPINTVQEIVNLKEPFLYYPHLKQQIISNSDCYMPHQIIYNPNLKVQSVCEPISTVPLSVCDTPPSVQNLIYNPVTPVPQVVYDKNSNVQEVIFDPVSNVEQVILSDMEPVETSDPTVHYINIANAPLHVIDGN